VRALGANDLVRGQFRGYREESGVARDSQVETFAALRLQIDSWRWQGVPIYLRAGKSLPVTCTEVVARLRTPPSVLYPSSRQNYLRFRIGPVTETAVGLNVMDANETGVGQTTELVASRHPGANERDAYERVLGDALVGDRTLFAREDYVEEAWRIVEPVLGTVTPVFPYEPGTWGPKEAAAITPPGGWVNPIVNGEAR
jgi:glucose-6-phosphate 1-dehydrogenase